MKKLLVLVFLGVAAARLSDEKCKEYYKEPSVKNDDLINEYPYMGLLGYPNGDEINYQCPATLISESYVLAPAFCMTSSQGKPNYVLLGTSDSEDKNPNHKLLDITEIIIHPKYNRNEVPNRHTLALAKFSPPITDNNNIRPGCLYTKNIGDKQTLIDLLWDTVSDRHLTKVNSSIIPTESCIKSYKSRGGVTIDEYSHLCVNRTFSNEYIPNIGGASHVIEDGIPKIVAIDNFGPRIPSPEHPDVSTKLFNYLDWIEENVWKK